MIAGVTWDHGRRKDFLQGGAKNGEIWFLTLEIEKTTFFAEIFKIHGGSRSPAPLPTPMTEIICFKIVKP